MSLRDFLKKKRKEKKSKPEPEVTEILAGKKTSNSRTAPPVCPPEKYIRVVAGGGVEYMVPEPVLLVSKTMKRMLEGNHTFHEHIHRTVEFLDISPDVMEVVIRYCMAYYVESWAILRPVDSAVDPTAAMQIAEQKDEGKKDEEEEELGSLDDDDLGSLDDDEPTLPSPSLAHPSSGVPAPSLPNTGADRTTNTAKGKKSKKDLADTPVVVRPHTIDESHEVAIQFYVAPDISFQVLKTAHYLGIRPLVDLSARLIAHHISDVPLELLESIPTDLALLILQSVPPLSLARWELSNGERATALFSEEHLSVWKVHLDRLEFHSSVMSYSSFDSPPVRFLSTLIQRKAEKVTPSTGKEFISLLSEFGSVISRHALSPHCSDFLPLSLYLSFLPNLEFLSLSGVQLAEEKKVSGKSKKQATPSIEFGYTPVYSHGTEKGEREEKEKEQGIDSFLSHLLVWMADHRHSDCDLKTPVTLTNEFVALLTYLDARKRSFDGHPSPFFDTTTNNKVRSGSALKELVLFNTNMAEREAIALSAAITSGHVTPIEKIVFQHNFIRKDGAVALLRACVALPVGEVDLSANRIYGHDVHPKYAEDMKRLVAEEEKSAKEREGVEATPTTRTTPLVTLDLSHNNIGGRDFFNRWINQSASAQVRNAGSIGNVFRQNSPVFDDAVSLLGEILPPSLSSLNLSQNHFQDIDVIGLLARCAPNLQELSLAFNRIGDETMVHWLSSASSLPLLREINLQETSHNLSEEAFGALSSLLSQIHLQTLNITGIYLRDEQRGPLLALLTTVGKERGLKKLCVERFLHTLDYDWMAEYTASGIEVETLRRLDR